jgi:DNA repair exonuclease SbcCD ATPase subunit
MSKKKSTNQKEANKSISEAMLESCRGALFKLKDQLDNIEFEDGEDISEAKKKSDTILNTIERLGKAFETLAVLEKKVQSEEDLKGKARGNVKLGMFEDNI